MKWMILKIIGILINLGVAVALFFNGEKSLGVFFGGLVIYQIYIYISLKDMKKVTHFTKRSRIGSIALNFIILAIVARLINIQVIKSENYSQAVSRQVEGTDRKTGKRGEVFDNNGKKLAYNASSYEIGVEPQRFVNDENAVRALKRLKDEGHLDFDVDKLLIEIPILAERKSKYKIIEKKIEEFKKNEIAKILKDENVHKWSIIFSEIPERRYYKNSIYRNIVGNIGYSKDETGENKIGVLGIERQYDSYLKERKVSTKHFFTKARDIKLPTSQQKFESFPNGKNVYLTIDYEINDILNTEMEKQFKATGSEEAHGIVMDPNTGRIVAMASFSTLNRSTRNSLIQDQYEPGSTFKPIIIAAAMEAGYINERTNFDIGNGTIRKYNKTIKEASRSTRGILTTEDIMMKSSNVGMVLMGDKFTDEQFEDWLKRFGLYDRTGVDFPNELKPFAPSYRRWDRLKKSTMSFGQGIVTTPIQLATAFSAVVNGGIMYRPYLVDRIESQEGVVIRRNLPTEVSRVISEDVSKKVKAMMENTVMDGTGKRAIVEGYRVGGKTGTGQVSAPWGGYFKNEYLASFIGFFPVEKPQYVVLTMFLKPQGSTVNEKYGGTVASPIFGEIIRGITKNKDILSENIRRIDSRNLNSQRGNLIGEVEKIEIMPKLVGLTSTEVLRHFKDSRFKMNLSGRGVVKTQEPAPGTDLEDYETIEVVLEESGERKK